MARCGTRPGEFSSALCVRCSRPSEPQPGTLGPDREPVGTARLVEGTFGKAAQFALAPKASGGFFTARVGPTPAWDASAGFGFRVKGDGSRSWGGLERARQRAVFARDDVRLGPDGHQLTAEEVMNAIGG